MKFRFEVSGIKELQREFEKLGDELVDELEEAVLAGADVVVREAKLNSRKGGTSYPHRRTGTLMRSIKVLETRKDRTKVEADVGSAVEYARRVEKGFMGTDRRGRRYNQPPRPFLRPAIDENEPEILKAVNQKLQRKFRRRS